MQQFLECDGYVKVQRFGSPTNEGYDGIHFKGKLGVQHFTRSFLNILLDSLPNRVLPSHLQFGSSQGQESYTNVVRKNIQVQNSSSQNWVQEQPLQSMNVYTEYSLPLKNRFSVLEDNSGNL